MHRETVYLSSPRTLDPDRAGEASRLVPRGAYSVAQYLLQRIGGSGRSHYGRGESLLARSLNGIDVPGGQTYYSHPVLFFWGSDRGIAGIAAPRARSARIFLSDAWLEENFNERLVFLAFLVSLFVGPASGPIGSVSVLPDPHLSGDRSTVG